MVKDLKYILKRILIGVGIALILMAIKDKSFILSAKAESFTFAPNNSKYVRIDGTQYNQPISSFSFNSLPGVDFYGFVSNTTGTVWSYAQYTIPLTNNLKKGYYNIDYLFYNNWQSSKLNTYSFSVYHNEQFTTCVGNGSNITSSTNITVKNVITVKCENVYIDTSTANSLYLNIYPNNATSYGDTIGVTKVNFNYLPSNGQQAVADAQQETNDILSNDDIDEEGTSSSISSLNDKNATNGSITQLLTLPITLFQSVLNSVNGSCSSFNLGNLLGTNLVMPCINLQNILGSTLYGIIDILLCGLFILVFRKKMVDIFNHMTSLNDRGNELE